MGIFSLFTRGCSKPKSTPFLDSAQPEASFVVHITDEDVSCVRPDGRVESVKWDDLQAVIIHTTEDGPAAPDVFWILAGTDMKSGCVIPHGATGDSELLVRLQKLPGFDNEALIRSMSSTDDQKFLCWRRQK